MFRLSSDARVTNDGRVENFFSHEWALGRDNFLNRVIYLRHFSMKKNNVSNTSVIGKFSF